MESLENEIKDIENLGWLDSVKQMFQKTPEWAKDYVEILETMYNRQYPNLRHYAQAQYIITR